MLFRAFYALPDSIKGEGGRPVNALLGTANLVLREVDEHSPRAVVLCFGPDAADYRVELYDGYHADRPEVPGHAGAAVRGRAGVLRGVRLDGDVVRESSRPTTCSARMRGSRPRRAARVLVMTGDRDMYQCATRPGHGAVRAHRRARERSSWIPPR